MTKGNTEFDYECIPHQSPATRGMLFERTEKNERRKYSKQRIHIWIENIRKLRVYILFSIYLKI